MAKKPRGGPARDSADKAEGGALKPGMDVESFKSKAVEMLDDALAHSWIVRGDNRKLLSALRTAVTKATPEMLKLIIDNIPPD